jgi:hypothetical protein
MFLKLRYLAIAGPSFAFAGSTKQKQGVRGVSWNVYFLKYKKEFKHIENNKEISTPALKYARDPNQHIVSSPRFCPGVFLSAYSHDSNRRHHISLRPKDQVIHLTLASQDFIF